MAKPLLIVGIVLGTVRSEIDCGAASRLESVKSWSCFFFRFQAMQIQRTGSLTIRTSQPTTLPK